LLTQFQAIPHYLRLVFVPWPLCLDYKWPLVKDVTRVLPAAAILIPAGVLILRGVWKRRPAAFLPFAFFAILAPTSSVIPLPDTVFEHRMYLPLAAVIGAVVAGGYALGRRLVPGRTLSGRASGLCVVLSVLVVGMLALMTQQRNKDYSSEETLWRDVLKTRPDNYRAYISLSTTLVGQGRAEEAAEVCRGLLGRLPDFARMSFPEIERRWNEDRSVPCAEYAMAHNNLGAALLLRDRMEEARTHFSEAIRVLPRATWARKNLAKTFFLEHRSDDAIAEWQTVLRLDAHDVQVYGFLGMAYMAKDQYALAASHYREALRLSPDDGFIRTQLAWLLATCPDDKVRDGAEAVEVAKPLLQLSQQRSARAFDVLGAAYAEARDFQRAIEMAERALLLIGEEKEAAPRSPEETALSPSVSVDSAGEGAGQPGSSGFEQAVRARLERYRQKLPARIGKPADQGEST
jgi:tetratricopeptide (TPR) repeat protein